MGKNTLCFLKNLEALIELLSAIKGNCASETDCSQSDSLVQLALKNHAFEH